MKIAASAAAVLLSCLTAASAADVANLSPATPPDMVATYDALADVILKLAGEVRQQLGLQLAISRTLVDFRVVKEFQETVIAVIREESPATARRIVARLKERRALRPSVELPTLTGDPHGDVA